MSTRLRSSRLETPVGPLVVFAREGALCILGFGGRPEVFLPDLERRFGPIGVEETADPAGAITALARYLEGDLYALDAVSVDLGGTPFQQHVWSALREIPAGRTVSYSELARRIGMPSAVRAVAAANARNPVSIVVPCHRVIGADGSLTGYGGGLDRKRWLLAHEGAFPSRQAPLPFASV